ncbi:MAG: NTP transferase domain-containing protein [Acidimicrobiales bacterium]|nr:NTP transferase domain-containing protein [Acidimicrobiales bacterium]
MKAVIMAGGEGTRLRPLTSNCPKPMLPVANLPMMEHVVGLLRRHGVTDIVVTVAYLANQIRTYFGDGSEFGVNITYATEEKPLGTAGSVRNAAADLGERFLVISGDVLTDIDLGKIIAFHEERKAMATIGLVAVENPLEFGIVITREDGSIERFLEKPTWGQVFSDTINTGIFVLEPEIFDHIPDGRAVDFSEEVFPAVLEAGLPIYGAVGEGYWEDVGTLESYVSVHKDVMDGRVQVDVPGFALDEGIWLGEGANLHPDAIVDGFAVIGENCRIEAGARIGDYAVLGRNVRVRAGADIERSVVHENTYLAEGVTLRGAVVGRSSDLRRGARCDDGSVIGDECFIGADAHVAADVKIYPFKTVEAGAVVNTSIIWESKGARSLFGRDGVSGLANVDINPELAAKVAMAFATSLRAGTTVVTSRDSSRAARMLKRAFMAGLNSSGVNVLDLEVATVPVTRFLTRTPQVEAGVTIRLVDGDPQSVVIRFFDDDGLDIAPEAKRKIERLFDREDFRRVFAAEIGDISFPARALEAYSESLGSTVDLPTVRAAKFKLVVDYSFGATAFVLPTLLGKLGADVLGVNPYISTVQRIEVDLESALENVSRLVRSSGAHLGAVLDPDGEHLYLIDDTGHVLSADESRLAMVSLVAGHMDADRVALPVNVSSVASRLLEPCGMTVQHTKTSTAALMAAASEPRVGFAASGDGGFIVPSFLPAFDASAALVLLLELLAQGSTTLSKVREGLPRVHLAHERVVTPWEQKGLVMRTLVELSKDRPVELIDGVKVLHDDGWVLALPDPEEPVTHIWAEGPDQQSARRLAQEYVRRIRQCLR